MKPFKIKGINGGESCTVLCYEERGYYLVVDESNQLWHILADDITNNYYYVGPKQ